MKRNPETLNSLRLYFQSVKSIPILSPEEERDLISRAQAGERKAFIKLIVSNQRIVIKEALRYCFKDDNLLDMIMEGNKGLIMALRKFELDRGTRFFTYALWWVRSEIRRFISKNQNIISLPDIFYNDYLKFKKANYHLLRKLGHQPTESELAAYLEIPLKKVKVLKAVPEDVVSLDKSINDDNQESLSAILPDQAADNPEKILMGMALNDLLAEELEDLSEREAEIIRLRFGFQGRDPMKLREIAKKLNMSAEGVRRIEIKALAKMRAKLAKQGIYGVLN